NLSRQLESGVIMIKRFGVSPRSAMYVGNHAKGDQLLGQVPDIFGDQARSLMINKRLVVTCRALVDGTDVIEHLGFIRQVAYVTVYRERLPVGSECFLVAAFVTVDAANVLVQDRLGLRAAYFTIYLQRLLVRVERVPVVTAVQMHPAQIVVHLRFPAPVADVTIERKRRPHVSICLAVTAQMPAGDTGMAQGIGHAARVRGGLVQNPGFGEIGERLTGTGCALVCQAYLVEGLGLASLVGERPADRGGFLSQGDCRLVLPGLLAHRAERQRRPRDPGR